MRRYTSSTDASNWRVSRTGQFSHMGVSVSRHHQGVRRFPRRIIEADHSEVAEPVASRRGNSSLFRNAASVMTVVCATVAGCDGSGGDVVACTEMFAAGATAPDHERPTPPCTTPDGEDTVVVPLVMTGDSDRPCEVVVNDYGWWRQDDRTVHTFATPGEPELGDVGC